MEKTFETEVLSRLAVIESKLDDYKNIKEKVEFAYNKSINNEEDIKTNKQEIKEVSERVKVIEEKPAKKWDNVIMTTIGTVVGGIVGAIITLIFKK